MITEYWTKACNCRGSSSTGQILPTPVPYEEHGIPNTAVVRWTYYPQPVCDICGTPWRKEIPEATS